MKTKCWSDSNFIVGREQSARCFVIRYQGSVVRLHHSTRTQFFLCFFFAAVFTLRLLLFSVSVSALRNHTCCSILLSNLLGHCLISRWRSGKKSKNCLYILSHAKFNQSLRSAMPVFLWRLSSLCFCPLRREGVNWFCHVETPGRLQRPLIFWVSGPGTI